MNSHCVGQIPETKRIFFTYLGLTDFCKALNLYIDVDYESYNIDYTYHFAMKAFHTLDHFAISQELFVELVGDIYVLHEVDNTSDHEPICLKLDVDHLVNIVKPRPFEPKIAWHKASPKNLATYANVLKQELASLYVPYSALMCHNILCKNASHNTALSEYITDVSNCCMRVAKLTLPVTSPRAARGHIPGCSADVEPKRRQSLFWHGIWVCLLYTSPSPRDS